MPVLTQQQTEPRKVNSNELNEKISQIEHMRRVMPYNSNYESPSQDAIYKVATLFDKIKNALLPLTGSFVWGFGGLAVVGNHMDLYNPFPANGKLMQEVSNGDGTTREVPIFGATVFDKDFSKGLIKDGLVSMAYQNALWLFVDAFASLHRDATLVGNVISEVELHKFNIQFKENIRRQLISQLGDVSEHEYKKLADVIDDALNGKFNANKPRFMGDDYYKLNPEIDSVNKKIKELGKCRDKAGKAKLKELKTLKNHLLKIKSVVDTLHVHREMSELLRQRRWAKLFNSICSKPRVVGRIIITRAVWDATTVWGFAQGMYVWLFGNAAQLIKRGIDNIFRIGRDAAETKVKLKVFGTLFKEGENGFKHGIFKDINYDLIERNAGALKPLNLEQIKAINLLYKLKSDNCDVFAKSDDRAEFLSEEQRNALEAVGKDILTLKQKKILNEISSKIIANTSYDEINAYLRELDRNAKQDTARDVAFKLLGVLKNVEYISFEQRDEIEKLGDSVAEGNSGNISPRKIKDLKKLASQILEDGDKTLENNIRKSLKIAENESNIDKDKIVTHDDALSLLRILRGFTKLDMNADGVRKARIELLKFNFNREKDNITKSYTGWGLPIKYRFLNRDDVVNTLALDRVRGSYTLCEKNTYRELLVKRRNFDAYCKLVDKEKYGGLFEKAKQSLSPMFNVEKSTEKRLAHNAESVEYVINEIMNLQTRRFGGLEFDKNTGRVLNAEKVSKSTVDRVYENERKLANCHILIKSILTGTHSVDPSDVIKEIRRACILGDKTQRDGIIDQQRRFLLTNMFIIDEPSFM